MRIRRRHARGAPRAAVALTGLLAALVLGAGGLALAYASPRPRVLLMGDSLAWEAAPDFTAALRSVHAEVRSIAYGGTALCDALPLLTADLRSFRPRVVVVEYTGNAFTPCMKDRATGLPLRGDALAARYGQDAQRVMQAAASSGAQVWWASAPVDRFPNPTLAAVDDALRQVAARWPDAHWVDAGQAVLDHGRYTGRMDCLTGEPCAGADRSTGVPSNEVRAPDGVHFCPVGAAAVRGVTAACPVWSSGAWRYGRAMAAPVAAYLASGA